MTSQAALTSTVQPDVFSLIERADLADSTKMQYAKAMRNYLATGSALTDSDALADYAHGLKHSSRAFLKSAVRLWARQMAGTLKAGATPGNIHQVQAALYRFEAIEAAITVSQSKGTKAHTWLSLPEVKRLLDTCDDSFSGKRDKLVLGLLVGAGLRRKELSALTFADIQTQPVKRRKRTVLAVRGKGAKDRVVPISKPLARAISAWGEHVSHSGSVFRRIIRKQSICESLSPIGIFNIVRKRGEMMDKQKLSPHDLRRTYAQLGCEAGVPITQICKLLGHASITTTQRYLNLELDLETTISDFVPFE